MIQRKHERCIFLKNSLDLRFITILFTPNANVLFGNDKFLGAIKNIKNKCC